MTQMNRREFVAAVACAACLCGLGGAGELLADAVAGVLDVGPKSNYSADGITDTWMKAPSKVAIVRHEGRIYACTTVCTHKGAIVKIDENNSAGFKCPKHKATYDIEGKVTKGPAKVALVHYAISVNADGHMIVDPSKSFTPDQWDDPSSFVKVG
jgi:Rieske Fe-S protein